MPVGLLLQVAGLVLVSVAAVAAVVLPGADANAEFTPEGWAWIIGVGVVGCLALIAGAQVRRR